MSDRAAELAEFHAAEVQPRRLSMRDMAGGTALDSVGAKSTVFLDEKTGATSPASLSSFDDNEPTEEERATLRFVADKLPWATFLVAVIELCERFTYYGVSGPFQNYIQHSYNDPSGLPGALGLGQVAATGLTDFFLFWCYLTPIGGAIVSDQFLGKYNTIIYRGNKQKIRVETNGERVIVDPGVTVQRIYMIFYLCINIGGLSSIATTEMEKNTGFWSAFLLCLLMFCVGIAVLVGGKKYYVVRPPRGGVILNAFRACWVGLVNKGNMDAAKPSYQEEHGRKHKTPWSDLFIDELKRGLVACKVFVFFPVYWLVYGQMLTNLVSQAGSMELHGIPNDIMQNIDGLTIIIFIPIMDRLVYPGLRKIGIPFRPITRITMGFVFGKSCYQRNPASSFRANMNLAALSMAYAAITQHLIYAAGPCYDAPLACPAADETTPNQVHVAVQTPAYFLIALSEIFASISGLEYAFTKAPPSMKSFVMSIFLFQTALGSALGIALAPTATDPKQVWMYTGIGIATIITAALFWFLFKHYNATEVSMNQLDENGQVAVKAHDINARGAVVVGEGDHHVRADDHGSSTHAAASRALDKKSGVATGADHV
ncbi:peptide transporter ptr2 [Pseudocyphellaria aurata]|nr:peptide transporter ptr2 [Pseudocyphellaria aurata]